LVNDPEHRQQAFEEFSRWIERVHERLSREDEGSPTSSARSANLDGVRFTIIA